MRHHIYTLMLIALWSYVQGYKSYQNKIPNGGRVPHPCIPGGNWDGVGHKKAGGGGDRNQFGLDFFANGKKWDKILCEKDSDGDGKTNGEELGDSDCTWREGDIDPLDDDISHPGICNPWNSPSCLANGASKWMTCADAEYKCDALSDETITVLNMTLQFNVTKVPAQQTTYICQMFDVEDVTRDYHLIANQPIIDNQHIMHHMILYGCEDRADVDSKLYSPYICNMSPGTGCSDVIGLWTVGFHGECLHEKTGFRLGKTGYKRIALELHWNNPLRVANYTDGSGMVLHFTPNLRQYDAGVLMVGQSFLEIPPGKDRVTVEGVCTPECTTALLTDKVYLVEAINHMHYLGRAEFVTQYRNGKFLRYLTNEPVYSYDSPQPIKYNTEVELLPGDEIRTVCEFTSKTNRKTTFFGYATSDEMCFAFFRVYPKQNMIWTQCDTWKSISNCKTNGGLADRNPIVNGCNWKEFINATSLTHIHYLVHETCNPYRCLEECIPVIKQLRQHPCMQGDVYDFIKVAVFDKTENIDWLKIRLSLHSCDVELDRLERTATSAPPCIADGVGSSAIHQMSRALAVLCFLVFSMLR